jgi:hypothetical protein
LLRHLAISMLLFGCSELLGIPEDPQLVVMLVPPDAAASTGPESFPPPEGDTSASAPPGSPGSSAMANDPLALAGGTADRGTDAGLVTLVPSDEATRPPGAEAMSAGGEPPPPACAPISRASISDFTFMPGDSPTEASFGVDAAFQGGTFFYPSGGTLTSDVTDGSWHLSGTVSTTSGFGLYSSACRPFDASAFTGIAFSLWGSIEGDQPITFYVESAAQQVSSLWANAHENNPTDPDLPPNSGRCIPATTRYDGTCREPRVMLTATPVPTTVEVPWADFAGGSPVSSVSSTEITVIAWALPVPGSSAYAVDLHIDDLRFFVP